MFTSPQEVLDFIKSDEIVFVDIRFTDMPGVQQHFNLPAKAIDEDFFVNGQLFDGSSIRGSRALPSLICSLFPMLSRRMLILSVLKKPLLLSALL